MRFAVIADIHGNALALEAVLADIDAHGISEILNLGDHLSGPLEAARTADLILARDMVSVSGNHDRYLRGDPADLHEWEADCWHELAPAHHAWLASLPFSRVWRDEVFLCHATPQSDMIYWLETVSPDGIVHARPLAEVETFAEGVSQSLILCGHTHLAQMVRLSDGRLIVNPGSVGCPAYDDDEPHPHKVEAGSPHAAYAVIERRDADWDVTFRRLPYDCETAAKIAEAKGRPHWATALRTGKN
ncbi:metallophosphoesterase family protein [Rhizobium sp. TRM95796]|uniref:metallophosphoesterase family protein n=1 Tax=Rhizobium sp. TRM95796 TaxID=2979862 RepID=UPI0021E82E13|nr:metallophosphoesterase family protein [Rhizobium sp. TRM95796]MCV3766707.1 metallophosphatase family protein [Rhizobium sp. TRM95796]